MLVLQLFSDQALGGIDSDASNMAFCSPTTTDVLPLL